MIQQHVTNKSIVLHNKKTDHNRRFSYNPNTAQRPGVDLKPKKAKILTKFDPKSLAKDAHCTPPKIKKTRKKIGMISVESLS